MVQFANFEYFKCVKTATHEFILKHISYIAQNIALVLHFNDQHFDSV